MTDVQAQTDTLLVRPDIRLDTRSGLEPVKLDRERINDFKNNRDFDYTEYQQEENWWTTFKRWLAYKWNALMSKIFGNVNSKFLAALGIVLKYVLILGLIGFAIWLYVKLNPGTAFFKAKTPPEVLLSEDEKIISEQDIPKLIKEALDQGNYRLAIRYRFLLILRNLKERELIDYQFQKTNKEYSREIEDPEIARQFARLARLYDFTWYGDFEVNALQYGKAEKDFEVITQNINNLKYA